MQYPIKRKVNGKILTQDMQLIAIDIYAITQKYYV